MLMRLKILPWPSRESRVEGLQQRKPPPQGIAEPSNPQRQKTGKLQPMPSRRRAAADADGFLKGEDLAATFAEKAVVNRRGDRAHGITLLADTASVSG